VKAGLPGVAAEKTTPRGPGGRAGRRKRSGDHQVNVPEFVPWQATLEHVGAVPPDPGV
jgi:hypothetical protein